MYTVQHKVHDAHAAVSSMLLLTTGNGANV